MKTSIARVMGLNFPVQVYDSIQELVLAAGTEDKALEIANDNLTYRGPAATIRNEFSEFLEQTTGFDRLVTGTKKAKEGEEAEQIFEPAGQYIARLRAKAKAGELDSNGLPANEEQLEAHLQSLADRFVSQAATPFVIDAATPDKKPGKAKAPRKACLAIATKLHESQVFDKFLKRCAKFKITPGAHQTGDKDKDILALAWAIQAVQDAEEAASLNAWVAS